jgi:hypothetical protein
MTESSREIEESLQKLHPNWKALATVRLRPKIFIKSSGNENEDDTAEEESKKHSIQIDDSASRVYQEILQMPSTSTTNVQLQKAPKKKTKTKVEIVPFSKELLFRLAMQNDTEGIEKHLKSCIDPDLNATDSFGWTALMMAACEGASKSFLLLLSYGANLFIKDRSGNTAITLATKHNHKNILEIANNYNDIEQSSSSSSSESEEEMEGNEKEFCGDCKIEISKRSSKSHKNSTVHLFSCKYNTSNTIKTFGIARSNKGYKMMKSFGWDGNSALGARQNGKLYPIKTTLRKGRTGLGIKQTDARITHFKAYDVNAVMQRSQPRVFNKKEIIRKNMKEKQRETILRRELS